MTIAATRYAQPYVESAGEREMQRRADLLRARLEADPTYAAAEAARRHRIERDPSLPDWLKDIYLDQTIFDNEQLKEMFDVSIQKIWDLSAPLQPKRRPRPHPRMTPEPDITVKVVGGRPSPGIQLGKATEWWVGAHRGLIDAINETLVPNKAPQRHGRTRGPEVVENWWFVEHADRIAAIKRINPDWADDPSSTTITALLQLPQRQELGITDRTIAGQVSRCLRVMRSQELSDRKRKMTKKTAKKK